MRKREDPIADQTIVQDHVGTSEQPGSPQRQQLWVARPCTDDGDSFAIAFAGCVAADRHVITIAAPTVALLTGSMTMKLPIVRLAA